jgi:hypothetical protein
MSRWHRMMNHQPDVARKQGFCRLRMMTTRLPTLWAQRHRALQNQRKSRTYSSSRQSSAPAHSHENQQDIQDKRPHPPHDKPRLHPKIHSMPHKTSCSNPILWVGHRARTSTQFMLVQTISPIGPCLHQMRRSQLVIDAVTLIVHFKKEFHESVISLLTSVLQNVSYLLVAY